MSDGKRLSLGQNLIASGAAVVAATSFTHPVDVVKVRLQVADKSSASADAFSIGRFLRFWPELYQQEGSRVFLSGIAAASWRAATYGTARIGLCEPLQNITGGRTSGALLAGVLATVVGNPFEVLKVRLQATTSAKQSMPHAFKTMIREEGWAVLLRGFHWAALRSALLTAGQVVPYAKAKSSLQSVVGMSDGIACHVIASSMAGVVTTTLTAPVDVLKTRVMSSSDTDPVRGPLHMMRQEGAFVFFRGWLANYVRIGPQTMLILVFFEQTKALVQNFNA